MVPEARPERLAARAKRAAAERWPNAMAYLVQEAGADREDLDELDRAPAALSLDDAKR